MRRACLAVFPTVVSASLLSRTHVLHGAHVSDSRTGLDCQRIAAGATWIQQNLQREPPPAAAANALALVTAAITEATAGPHSLQMWPVRAQSLDAHMYIARPQQRASTRHCVFEQSGPRRAAPPGCAGVQGQTSSVRRGLAIVPRPYKLNSVPSAGRAKAHKGVHPRQMQVVARRQPRASGLTLACVAWEGLATEGLAAVLCLVFTADASSGNRRRAQAPAVRPAAQKPGARRRARSDARGRRRKRLVVHSNACECVSVRNAFAVGCGGLVTAVQARGGRALRRRPHQFVPPVAPDRGQFESSRFWRPASAALRRRNLAPRA